MDGECVNSSLKFLREKEIELRLRKHEGDIEVADALSELAFIKTQLPGFIESACAHCDLQHECNKGEDGMVVPCHGVIRLQSHIAEDHKTESGKRFLMSEEKFYRLVNKGMIENYVRYSFSNMGFLGDEEPSYLDPFDMNELRTKIHDYIAAALFLERDAVKNVLGKVEEAVMANKALRNFKSIVEKFEDALKELAFVEGYAKNEDGTTVEKNEDNDEDAYPF